MTFELERVISADHPSLPGHFPDTPLVPGVVILDEVLATLCEWRSDCRIASIRTVKFLAPLKPEQRFRVSLFGDDDHGTELNFACRCEDRTIVEGRLEVCQATD